MGSRGTGTWEGDARGSCVKEVKSETSKGGEVLGPQREELRK